MPNFIRINKKIKKFNKNISVDGDKSLSIRWVLFSSMASGMSEAKNLLTIYGSLTNLNLESSIKEFSGKNFSDFKNTLSQVLIDKVVPIGNEIRKLLNDKSYLDDILFEGYKKANGIASEKIKKNS